VRQQCASFALPSARKPPPPSHVQVLPHLNQCRLNQWPKPRHLPRRPNSSLLTLLLLLPRDKLPAPALGGSLQAGGGGGAGVELLPQSVMQNDSSHTQPNAFKETQLPHSCHTCGENLFSHPATRGTPKQLRPPTQPAVPRCWPAPASA
jgi:hypothetical protein